MQQFTLNLHGLKRISTMNLNMEHQIICEAKDILLKDDKEVFVESHKQVSLIRASKSLLCPICKKRFSLQKVLDVHVATHTKHKCKICDKGFPAKWQLENHLLSHKNISNRQSLTKKELFICNVCNKNITDKSSFISHLNTHTNKKPSTVTAHQSMVCTEESSSIPSLNDDLSSETQRRHHTCNEGFEKSDSSQPLDVCADDEPFICEICKKEFAQGKSLKLHYHHIHKDKKTHICEFCDKVFRGSRTISKHRRTHMKKKSVHLWNIE